MNTIDWRWLLQQVLTVWNTLSLRRRIVVVGASLAIFAAVLSMSRIAAMPNMVLLYSGLESGAAGEVVSALEQRGVAYDVRGGSIFVPSQERDALRMTLASEGLPANNNKGYELLDNLTGFGTTSQMFDAAYWRAKEGELARTIVANPQFTQARVHIANSSANPFQRDVTPSASISVTSTGGVPTPAQARALKYLVASAVPGLVAENVAVIDSKGGLIGTDDETVSGGLGDDKADQLRDRVQRLVEARVGVGNAVVEVSVVTDTQSESIVERSFDPETRVVISSDTEERSNQSQDQGGGDVTVASNLPTGEAENGDSSSSQNSETRERINYEVSETRREITKAPGAIKRLSVAVLVNGTFEPNEQGVPTFVPLPEAQIAALTDLVGSAVGFDEARGDDITIRSLPFERPEGLGTTAVAPGWMDGLDTLSLLQVLTLAIVALILGLFVVRPILSSRAASDIPELPARSALALGNQMGTGNESVGDALTGEIDPEDNFDNLPAIATNTKFGEVETDELNEISADPVQRLRGLIDQRRDETVEILRSWLEEKEEAR